LFNDRPSASGWTRLPFSFDLDKISIHEYSMKWALAYRFRHRAVLMGIGEEKLRIHDSTTGSAEEDGSVFDLNGFWPYSICSGL
jgi:hypothetical protein